MRRSDEGRRHPAIGPRYNDPMRGCVAAISIFLSLVVPSVTAQCNFTPSFSGQFRASYADAVIDGNDLWTATGYGIQLYDRSVDPPLLKASIAIPGTTTVVRVGTPLSPYTYAASGSRIYSIRRIGSALQLAGSADAGASINDLLVTTTHIYAATGAGIQQFDLLDPANPAKTPATFQTTSPTVYSLAASGSTLYAADGDSTVDVFSISIPTLPQKTGTLSSLARSISVEATSPGGSALPRLYVSDGQNTDVFVGTGATATKSATTPFGTTALTTLSGDVVVAAGSDRRWRAIDWTNAAAPVELFAADILPDGGTINRIGALRVAGNRLYVAAGDAGLTSWDVTGFGAPFPVRNYAIGATKSARWVDGRLYTALSAGGIKEFTKGSSGVLTEARQWDNRVHRLYDGRNGFLLSSTGSLLTYWTLTSTTPVLVSSSSFKAAVQSATVAGSSAYVVLSDGTLWSADLSQQSPQPQQIALTDFNAFSIASDASPATAATALAIAGYRADGTLIVSYSAISGFPSTTNVLAVPGVATTDLILSGRTAAVFTYRGINILDFTNGQVSAIPQSNKDIATALAFTTSSILESTETALNVWSRSSGALLRSFPLPVSSNGSLAADVMAAITTTTGVTGVLFDAPITSPKLASTRGGNTYYKKIAAAGDRFYAFDGRGVDIFTTTFGTAPHFLASVKPSGIFDFAISDAALFTITSSGVINKWSREGVQTAQGTLNEGSNVQVLRISSAGGAAWVSIAKGCTTGSCQEQTIVFEPQNLARTAALDGAAVDVWSSGARAYAIFELPSEIRAYSITDPQHPSLVTSRATEGATAPVSIAAAAGSVYVLGEKLYVYNDSTLTKSGEQLASFQSDPSQGWSYVDQRVRVDGSCGFISGRSASPQLYAVPQWSSTAAPTVPAAVRSVATLPGEIFLLTDDSIEVWTTQAAPPLPRRRPSR